MSAFGFVVPNPFFLRDPCGLLFKATPLFRMKGSALRWLAVGKALARGIASVLGSRGGRVADLDHWKKSVRLRFPEVPQLSTDELGGWLADARRLPPVLLDVRTPPEFALSHLPGAIRVDPGADPSAVACQIPDQRPVVVYCSVGWRSSELAARWRQALGTEVMNLEGSIFAWANEDRPLESAVLGPPRVHPYQAIFGRLLRPEKRGRPGGA